MSLHRAGEPGGPVLLPLALFLGVCGLAAFFWSMPNSQFEDLNGAGMRVLMEDNNS